MIMLRVTLIIVFINGIHIRERKGESAKNYYDRYNIVHERNTFNECIRGRFTDS